MARPHLKVPFQIVGARALTVEDGSLDEVIQNVGVIVGTYRGERLVVPDYGISDPAFARSDSVLNDSEIVAAVARWEPRADITIERPSFDGSGEVDITIGVAMKVAG